MAVHIYDIHYLQKLYIYLYLPNKIVNLLRELFMKCCLFITQVQLFSNSSIAFFNHSV